MHPKSFVSNFWGALHSFPNKASNKPLSKRKNSICKKNNHELQANYTRRINRPRGRQLNSFRNTSDSTNIEFGNPLLDPEISSAVELNYIKTWDNHALSASIYYRFSDNVIERVRYLDANNVMYTTFENISKRQSLGIELVSKNK